MLPQSLCENGLLSAVNGIDLSSYFVEHGERLGPSFAETRCTDVRALQRFQAGKHR